MPVTIAKGAIEVHPAVVHAHAPTVSVPVTIESGAIQHTTHVAAPATKSTTTKTVTRDAKHQITQVVEETD